eukprot:scaffold72637_cov36-Tisochrysis_lutea.AAC.1
MSRGCKQQQICSCPPPSRGGVPASRSARACSLLSKRPTNWRTNVSNMCSACVFRPRSLDRLKSTGTSSERRVQLERDVLAGTRVRQGGCDRGWCTIRGESWARGHATAHDTGVSGGLNAADARRAAQQALMTAVTSRPS